MFFSSFSTCTALLARISRAVQVEDECDSDPDLALAWASAHGRVGTDLILARRCPDSIDDDRVVGPRLNRHRS